MKTNTKSSITLPPDELKLVVRLKAMLKAKSKVEVVRRGIQYELPRLPGTQRSPSTQR